MLNFFRRQHSRLKWIWIVVIAVFSVTLVTLYIPITDIAHVNLTNNVARVGSEVVTAQEFQNAYHGYMDQVGADMTPEMLLAFGFDTQVMDALIDQYVLDEADAELAPGVAALGMEPLVAPTVMKTDADRAALAQFLIDAASG